MPKDKVWDLFVATALGCIVAIGGYIGETLIERTATHGEVQVGHTEQLSAAAKILARLEEADRRTEQRLSTLEGDRHRNVIEYEKWQRSTNDSLAVLLADIKALIRQMASVEAKLEVLRK